MYRLIPWGDIWTLTRRRNFWLWGSLSSIIQRPRERLSEPHVQCTLRDLKSSVWTTSVPKSSVFIFTDNFSRLTSSLSTLPSFSSDSRIGTSYGLKSPVVSVIFVEMWGPLRRILFYQMISKSRSCLWTTLGDTGSVSRFTICISLLVLHVQGTGYLEHKHTHTHTRTNPPSPRRRYFNRWYFSGWTLQNSRYFLSSILLLKDPS